MAHYVSRSENFEKCMTALEPHAAKPKRRDRNSKSSSTKPAVAQKTKNNSEINTNPSTECQGNQRQLAGNSNQSADRNQPQNIADITTVSLRTRIIHLLALGSHKKLELCDRIERGGISYLERRALMLILKQVSFFIEDTYYLRSCMWDEVQEGWPYYTKEEKAVIKRRKAASLTSPDSDDGSTGSRSNSPNSVDPESPSMTIAAPALELARKRPSYQDNDGLSTKRPRTSN